MRRPAKVDAQEVIRDLPAPEVRPAAENLVEPQARVESDNSRAFKKHASVQ
jgi:hypothetical protein